MSNCVSVSHNMWYYLKLFWCAYILRRLKSRGFCKVCLFSLPRFPVYPSHLFPVMFSPPILLFPLSLHNSVFCYFSSLGNFSPWFHFVYLTPVVIRRVLPILKPGDVHMSKQTCNTWFIFVMQYRMSCLTHNDWF